MGNGCCGQRKTEAWHSPVTEAELAAACGILDPAHPGTRQIVEKTVKIIEQRSTYQIITPDPDIWRSRDFVGHTHAFRGMAKTSAGGS
jgi:hypothetical protein